MSSDNSEQASAEYDERLQRLVEELQPALLPLAEERPLDLDGLAKVWSLVDRGLELLLEYDASQIDPRLYADLSRDCDGATAGLLHPDDRVRQCALRLLFQVFRVGRDHPCIPHVKRLASADPSVEVRR
jgi:hypothetical protein